MIRTPCLWTAGGVTDCPETQRNAEAAAARRFLVPLLTPCATIHSDRSAAMAPPGSELRPLTAAVIVVASDLLGALPPISHAVGHCHQSTTPTTTTHQLPPGILWLTAPGPVNARLANAGSS